MKELKAYLELNPKIKKVWINKKGEWLFVKREGFAEKSRADVMGMKEDKAEKDTPPAADGDKGAK